MIDEFKGSNSCGETFIYTEKKKVCEMSPEHLKCPLCQKYKYNIPIMEEI